MQKRALTSLRSPFSSSSPRGVGRGRLLVALMCLGGTAALAAGCSESDGGDSPFAEYTGTWRVDFGTAAAPASVFSLTCPTLQSAVELPLWDKMIFQPGTVSDLVETAGPADCQFAFDVNQKFAAVPATDPLTGMPTTCTTLVNSGQDPTTGDQIELYLEVKPSPWEFRLQTPVKGQAPTAQLVGTSKGRLIGYDTTTSMGIGSDAGCVYDLVVKLVKIAQD